MEDHCPLAVLRWALGVLLGVSLLDCFLHLVGHAPKGLGQQAACPSAPKAGATGLHRSRRGCG